MRGSNMSVKEVQDSGQTCVKVIRRKGRGVYCQGGRRRTRNEKKTIRASLGKPVVEQILEAPGISIEENQKTGFAKEKENFSTRKLNFRKNWRWRKKPRSIV